jgi:hypothetical protein
MPYMHVLSFYGHFLPEVLILLLVEILVAFTCSKNLSDVIQKGFANVLACEIFADML